MNDFVSLVSIGMAFFVVAVSPGPATISNATVAMSHGRKVSFIYGLGLSCGLVFWGGIAASGMGAVLQSSFYVLMVLKVLGGLYLLWLAFVSARSALQPESESTTSIQSRNWFFKGLLLNISNPKSVIAWMAALSIGLDANDSIWSVAAATSVCIVVGFAVNALYTLLFSMKGVMQGYQRCRRWVSGVVAGLFTLAGVGLIRSAFAR
ncbi:LysE family transporter [Marinomonas mediterranea]|uniref:LysE family translocator n=1 Tax=Marinomonas mediterranea TaxID=119864 RepID=UPI00234B7644|nr:LysE family translocator [Marinomonas mediterranea]WCN13993.1 LysE family transporter [Marinomonas mediterranea]